MSVDTAPKRFALTRRIGVVAVLFIALLALVYRLATPHSTSAASGSTQTAAGDWVTLKRGDFEVLCREEGELKPVKVTSMTFLRWGKISFMAPEGSYVKKGDKVVALETKDLEDEISHMQEDVSAAERNLTQLEQNRDLEIKRLNTDLQAEKEKDAFEDVKLHELFAKPLQVDKDDAQNQLNAANARLENAVADLAAYKPLADKGFGKGTDLAAKEVAMEKAKVEKTRSEMKFRIAMDGALPWEREKGKLDRENEALALKIKQIDVDDQTDTLNVKVRGAERALTHLKRKLEKRELDLQRSTLLAPHDGIVVYRTIEWRGNKKVEVGEMVGPWLSPIDLPQYDKMKVRTQVPESFINRIKARPSVEQTKDGPAELTPTQKGTGSKARVTVKTLPDRIYSAEVNWIDGWARDRNSKLSDADIKAQGLSGVRVFDVEVELDESDTDRLREGFRATVDFPVELHKDVIAIPINAISSRAGTPRVQVMKDGVAEWRAIELGIQSLDKVIVTANLADGEQIFVPRTVNQVPVTKKKVAEDEPMPKRRGGGMGGAGMGGGGGMSPSGMSRGNSDRKGGSK